ncbi:MAG TPA: VCBS repeat-containing protein [Urbifossiella sp.]|nr:VCBS repeat-containing protein [Urbifossiella sp.]
MDCKTRLSVQPLEDRSVPALLLSDVQFGVAFGNGDTQQYFELKGDPGTNVPGKTYLVVVDGDPGQNAPGVINSVFDLSGAALGSNGYLAVVQAGNAFTFSPGTAVLTGTAGGGFGGLGGTVPDRFSDNSTLSNRFEFIFGTNSFLLVRANTAPVAGDDVDFDNDGLLDSAASTWTVLDSVGAVGTFTGSTAQHVGYGKINFSEGGLGISRYGPTITAESYGHVARVDESTGYAPLDWVAGLPRSVNGGPLRYDASIFGHPTQREFVGLRTDTLGTPNFASHVGGRVFTDNNGNGVFDGGDTGVAGQTVWVDRNANGLLDSYQVVVDPEQLPNGFELTNFFDRVTLSTSSINNPTFDDSSVQVQNINPGVGTQPTTGTGIFGWGPGFNFWTSGTGLRGDFYRPVQSISLDMIGTTITAQIGRLEVFADDGTLLAFVTTQGLLDGQSETMTIDRATADIAYFRAYPDPTGFPFNYFDNLRFTLPEDSATTDATGAYKIGLLQDGDYTIRTIGGAQLPATITDLVPVDNVNFPTGGGIGGGGPGGGTGLGGRGRTLAVGGGPGAVTVYGAVNGVLSQASIINFPVLFPDAPFDGTYRTATGDVNGDGIEDVVVVTGPGSPVRWGAIDGRTGNTLLVPLTAAFSGSEAFTGGGFVSVGDLDGDGRAEVVLTPDQGGGARVTIFSVFNVGARVRGNYLGISDPNFRGGARTAIGDVNGDGRADLLVAAGFQGGPRVALYDGKQVFTTGLARLTSDFFAFDPSLRNGVYASIGDVDGDGFGDLVIGAGSGGAPAVRVLSGRTLTQAGGPGAALASPIADFFVNGDASSRTGVRVATKNVDGDNRADVIAGSGEGQFSQVRVYAGATTKGRSEPAPIQDIDPFGVALTEGVFVG